MKTSRGKHRPLATWTGWEGRVNRDGREGGVVKGSWEGESGREGKGWMCHVCGPARSKAQLGKQSPLATCGHGRGTGKEREWDGAMAAGWVGQGDGPKRA